MKTFPHHRDDGTLVGFEITSSWIVLGPLVRLLRSVPGVTDVRRRWFEDDRVVFNFHGLPATVNEPWGDNSRYWVGLRDRVSHPSVDITPLHDAFKRYRGWAALRFWPFDGA